MCYRYSVFLFVWFLGFLFCFVDSIPCIALAVLKLTLETKLALNSETCLPLPPPSVGNKGVCHHTRLGVQS